MTRLLIPVTLVLLFVAQSVRIVAAEPFGQQQGASRGRGSVIGKVNDEAASRGASETRKSNSGRIGPAPYLIDSSTFLVIKSTNSDCAISDNGVHTL